MKVETCSCYFTLINCILYNKTVLVVTSKRLGGACGLHRKEEKCKKDFGR